MNNSFLSINEFAALLKMHPNTIRRAVRKGRISAFKVGAGRKASYRIPRSEIERLAIADMNIILNGIIKVGI